VVDYVDDEDNYPTGMVHHWDSNQIHILLFVALPNQFFPELIDVHHHYHHMAQHKQYSIDVVHYSSSYDK
jgi:hypothetical protein